MTAPLLILHARAEARAILFAAGDFTLGEALEPLEQYAQESGLLATIGEEVISEIILTLFQPHLTGALDG